MMSVLLRTSVMVGGLPEGIELNRPVTPRAPSGDREFLRMRCRYQQKQSARRQERAIMLRFVDAVAPFASRAVPPPSAEKTISRGASRDAETAEKGCLVALPAGPAWRPAQEGHEIHRNKQREDSCAACFWDLVTLLLARSASCRKGMSSRFLTCLLRALGVLCLSA